VIKRGVESNGSKSRPDHLELARELRSTRGEIHPRILQLIAERLQGKDFGFVKIVVQDGHVFAIEEEERTHLGR